MKQKFCFAETKTQTEKHLNDEGFSKITNEILKQTNKQTKIPTKQQKPQNNKKDKPF